MKLCRKCGETKPCKDFYKRSGTKCGLSAWCKICMDAQNKINGSTKSSPAKRKSGVKMYYKNRRKKLLKKYGITPKQYAVMLEQQNGVCAVCGKPETVIDSRNKTVRHLSVDHDHETGKVRGLLCQHCNHGLGYFRDNPHLLIFAAAYIRRAELL